MCSHAPIILAEIAVRAIRPSKARVTSVLICLAARRVIGVALRQFANGMQMFRQEHDRHHRDRPQPTHLAERFPQRLTADVGREEPLPTIRDRREEERPALQRAIVGTRSCAHHIMVRASTHPTYSGYSLGVPGYGPVSRLRGSVGWGQWGWMMGALRAKKGLKKGLGIG